MIWLASSMTLAMRTQPGNVSHSLYLCALTISKSRVYRLTTTALLSEKRRRRVWLSSSRISALSSRPQMADASDGFLLASLIGHHITPSLSGFRYWFWFRDRGSFGEVPSRDRSQWELHDQARTRCRCGVLGRRSLRAPLGQM